jgi:hypothetical protein
VAKHRVRGTKRSATFEWFDYRCAYCHSPEWLLDGFYEVDHIIPETLGGRDADDNLALSCPLCNRMKGSVAHGVDPYTELRVRLFHPRRQSWNRHFGWSENGLYIVGLTAAGRATIEALEMNSPRHIQMRSMWRRLGATPPDWEDPDRIESDR